MINNPPRVELNVLFFLISTLGFLFWGCSSSNNVVPDSIQDSNNIEYSLIYIIHGDADYLYHHEGTRYSADKRALDDAIRTARNATSGEVFIFHQKPEEKILWFFPKKDRRFYHFKNGKIIAEGKYSPVDGGFTKEIEIYKAQSNENQVRSMFFYFGHEIPSFKGQKYHSSKPKLSFDTKIFGNDLARFNSGFDLTVLSTCNNANPYVINELKNTTDFVVASPQNLHLSYLSLDKLKKLEENPKIDTEKLANVIAENSFHKLSSFLQTMVTVGIYNLHKTETYLNELNSLYKIHLQGTTAKPRFTDNTDCNTIPALQDSIDSTGVNIFFKPPNFGRKAVLKKHSGWGCKE
ncbi:MAG: hypothetical protein ROO71_12880 [Balneola sp.]